MAVSISVEGTTGKAKLICKFKFYPNREYAENERIAILKMHGRKCQCCGKTLEMGYLHVHYNIFWKVVTIIEECIEGNYNPNEFRARIAEGASMIRTKGEPGTGNVAEAVRHIRAVNSDIRKLKQTYEEGDVQELVRLSRELKISYELAEETAKLGRLPVVNFAAGEIATPADAAVIGVILNA